MSLRRNFLFFFSSLLWDFGYCALIDVLLPSANEWIQKLWYIYTMEFYAAERKKELIPFATAWMKLESIMLSEISQAVRDKYHMISQVKSFY